ERLWRIRVAARVLIGERIGAFAFDVRARDQMRVAEGIRALLADEPAPDDGDPLTHWITARDRPTAVRGLRARSAAACTRRWPSALADAHRAVPTGPIPRSAACPRGRRSPRTPARPRVGRRVRAMLLRPPAA